MAKYSLQIIVLALSLLVVAALVILGCTGYLPPSAWSTGGAINVAIGGLSGVSAAIIAKQ